jgi:hypothetical protein
MDLLVLFYLYLAAALLLENLDCLILVSYFFDIVIWMR